MTHRRSRRLLAVLLPATALLLPAAAHAEKVVTEDAVTDVQKANWDRPGNPLGRPGHVAEVASVIGFLASPRSAYVTGSSHTVDGGLSLMAAHGHDSATGWRET